MNQPKVVAYVLLHAVNEIVKDLVAEADKGLGTKEPEENKPTADSDQATATQLSSDERVQQLEEENALLRQRIVDVDGAYHQKIQAYIQEIEQLKRAKEESTDLLKRVQAFLLS